MIKVFHNPDFLKYQFGTENVKFFTADQVASVETDSLEYAYVMTNHIDHDWLSNRCVTPHVDRARSTSMGDIMQMEDTYFVVQDIGFRKLRPDEIEGINFKNK